MPCPYFLIVLFSLQHVASRNMYEIPKGIVIGKYLFAFGVEYAFIDALAAL